MYSHSFPALTDEDQKGEAWLIGGASNTRCAVLRQVGFSSKELQSLSIEKDPEGISPLEYYPLTKIGERFPVADSEKPPLLKISKRYFARNFTSNHRYRNERIFRSWDTRCVTSDTNFGSDMRRRLEQRHVTPGRRRVF